MEWKIGEASDDLTELLGRAEQDGPQRVQWRGKRFLVVVEDAPDEGDNPLIKAFLDEPEFKNLNIDRIEAPMRDTEL